MNDRKNDYKKHLFRALIEGAISLIWAVCTVNPFLVIGSVCSWIAYNGDSKRSAKVAQIFYIIGAVTSTLLALGVAFLGNVLSVLRGIPEIAGGAFTIIGAAAAADLLIWRTAVNTSKGIKELEQHEHQPESIGFFGSSDVYALPEEDEDKR